jgi:hypothetical protein
MNRRYLLGLCCIGIILSSSHLKAAADSFEACVEEYEKRHFSVLQNKRTSPKYRRIITSLQNQGEERVERELKKQRSKERAKLIALRKLRGACKKFSLLDINGDSFERRVSFDLSHNTISNDSDTDISSTCSHIAVCDDREKTKNFDSDIEVCDDTDSPMIVESDMVNSTDSPYRYDVIAEEYEKQFAKLLHPKSTEKKRNQNIFSFADST